VPYLRLSSYSSHRATGTSVALPKVVPKEGGLWQMTIFKHHHLGDMRYVPNGDLTPPTKNAHEEPDARFLVSQGALCSNFHERQITVYSAF
jgi:hypothetical protein